MSQIFVGIDLGGTNTKIGCFDRNLKLIDKDSIPTDVDSGPEVIVGNIGNAVKNILTKNKLNFADLAAAAIGSPGLMDLDAGIILAAHNLKFENVPLSRLLISTLKCPSFLENDANVTCWGEFVVGAGKGANDMILITLGTGIGGGIITNGELVHGFKNSAAELGHIIIYPDGRLCGCGQRGCVEAYASANATAARALEAIEQGATSSLKALLKDKGLITCKDVYDHLASGDKLAKEITDGTAKALAIFCLNMLHVTGPQRIVFFGGMIAAGDLLLKPVQRFFNEYLWNLPTEPVELCFATLGQDAGIIGTAALAMRNFQK